MNRETRPSSPSSSPAWPSTSRRCWLACSCPQSVGAAENGLLRHLAAAESGGDASIVEDHDAIGEADHLGELRRHEQDCGPVPGQLRDEPVRLLFRAHVEPYA